MGGTRLVPEFCSCEGVSWGGRGRDELVVLGMAEEGIEPVDPFSVAFRAEMEKKNVQLIHLVNLFGHFDIGI